MFSQYYKCSTNAAENYAKLAIDLEHFQRKRPRVLRSGALPFTCSISERYPTGFPPAHTMARRRACWPHIRPHSTALFSACCSGPCRRCTPGLFCFLEPADVLPARFLSALSREIPSLEGDKLLRRDPLFTGAHQIFILGILIHVPEHRQLFLPGKPVVHHRPIPLEICDTVFPAAGSNASISALRPPASSGESPLST